MAFLEKLAYQVGVDTDAAAADFTRIQRMIDGLGEQAKKTFDRDIGRSLANSIDPKNLESDLAKAKNVLARFGKDASDTFNKTLGRNVARSLTGETSKFADQLKATLGESFSFKNLALGSAAGLGIASLASSLLEGGKAAVKFAADFELALAQVEAIADKGFNTAAVREDIKNLAREVPQDLISLTKGLGDIIGSGITEASDALKVLEISAKAAVAGLTETGTASRGIVFVLNAYGKSAEEAAGISDILFKTVDEGVIKFDELTNVIGDVAGPAAQAGIEFGEIGAAIAFLTKQGISGAEATTSLRNLIAKIIDPAESAKAAAKSLGVELSLAGVKAAGGFTEFIAQIRKATGGDITKLQAIFPEERSFRAASRLAGEVGSEFQRLSGIFTDVAQTAGATEKAFAIINQTADQQWKLFKNNLSVAVADTGTSIIEGLLPALKSMNEAFAGLSELDETIAKLRSLGVAGDEVNLLSMQSNIQKTEKDLKQLNFELSNATNYMSSGARNSLGANAFTENLDAIVDGARAIGKEFDGIIQTEEGLNQARLRSVEIVKSLTDINKQIGDIQSKKVSATEEELDALIEQRAFYESQSASLVELIGLRDQIIAKEKELAQQRGESAKIENKITEDAKKQKENSANLLQVARELGIAANEFSFLTALEQQEKAKKNEEELLALQKKRKEAAEAFVAGLSDDATKQQAEVLIGQVKSVTDIAKAEANRQNIIDTIRLIYEKIDVLQKSGVAESSEEVLALQERAKALAEQAATAEKTLEFLRTQFQVQQEQKQEIVNVKKLSLEQLQEQLEALRQNKEANGELIKQVEKEIEGRKKSIELQKQAASFIADARKQIELLSASSDTERQLIQIRQQTQERVKMFGAQSEAAEAAYELERLQVKKIWDEFDKQALDSIKSAQKQFKTLRFDGLLAVLEPKLKLAVQSIQFEEDFIPDDLRQEAFRKVRDHITERLGEVAGSFDDFLHDLDGTVINVNDKLLGLSAVIFDGVNSFVPALHKYQDAIGDSTSTVFDKLSAGLSAFSVGASIALPLIKGLFGDSYAQRRQKELEEQRQKSEEARRALEAFNRELEETREAAEDAALGILRRDLEDVQAQIRIYTRLSRELSKAEFERYTELRLREEALLQSIEDARNAGDQELFEQLTRELEGVQEDLTTLGINFGHLNAEQLAALGRLIDKQEIYNEAIKEFGKFADTFAGSMNKLNLIFDLFDVEDPIAKLDLFQKEIEKKFGAILPTSAEGIDEFVRRGLAAFEAGGQELADFLTAMNLEELTAEEFLELLQTIEGFGDDIRDEVTPAVAKSLDDLLDRIQKEFELLEITAPTEKLQRFADKLRESFGASFFTNEGELRSFVDQGVAAFLAGGEELKAFLANFNLEELTAPEFENLLRSFKELLGEFDAAVQAQFDDIFGDLGLAADFLGEDDPALQLENLRARVNAEFEALIPQTEEQMRAFITQGAQALIAGGESLENFLRAFGLEELTKEQLEALLRSLQGFIVDMNAEADKIEEIKEDKLDFGGVKTITFQQGNKFIDEVITMRVLLTQMLDVMRAGSGFDPANGFAALSGLRAGEVRNLFFIMRDGNVARAADGDITPMERALAERAANAARASGQI